MRPVRTVKREPMGAVAVFGGTFDPVHYGHLRTALEVREQLQISDFRFLPAGNPPHRSGPVADGRHRLAMLGLAFGMDCGFGVDERELNRDGPSYMTDTLRDMRSEVGHAPLILVIGQDSANTLNGWHQWREIFLLAHLVIMTRSGEPGRYCEALDHELGGRRIGSLSELHSRASGCVMNIEVTCLSVSSSRIRKMIRDGKSPRFLLPEPVRDYIREHGLYQ